MYIRRRSFGIVIFAAAVFSFIDPMLIESKATTARPMAEITYSSRDHSIGDFLNARHDGDNWIRVSNYWSGSAAPKSRGFKAKLIWSDTAFYALFDAQQAEDLVVSSSPDLTKKAMNLWDRDVVEIFLAPDGNEPRKYFEFEVAPTGEWLDVAIDLTSGERITDWDYRSGMETAARIEEGRILMVMKIPWKAFGRKPKTGDVWLGNIFRCVGKGPERGYLAWLPTRTEKPNFHVPERFGDFKFVDRR